MKTSTAIIAFAIGSLMAASPAFATCDPIFHPSTCTGAQGPQGPQGAQGPQGPQGAQGPQGPQGVQGNQGIPGIDGTDGAQGVAGTNGSDGATGDKGAKGDKGDAGQNGADGKDGTVVNLDRYNANLATVAALTVPHVEKNFAAQLSAGFAADTTAIGVGFGARIDRTFQFGGSIATDTNGKEVSGKAVLTGQW